MSPSPSVWRPISSAAPVRTTGAPTGAERVRCGPGRGWGVSASRGGRPPVPSIGDQLLDLRIERHRRRGSLASKDLLIHQVPEPVEGVGTARLTEREQKPSAPPPDPEAAMGMGVRVDVGADVRAGHHRSGTTEHRGHDDRRQEQRSERTSPERGPASGGPQTGEGRERSGGGHLPNTTRFAHLEEPGEIYRFLS